VPPYKGVWLPKPTSYPSDPDREHSSTLACFMAILGNWANHF